MSLLIGSHILLEECRSDKRLESGNLDRRIDVPSVKREMILGNEVVEAKVLLAVQQKNLLEQDQERPADPEMIRSRDDDKIDVSLLARHAFGKFA